MMQIVEEWRVSSFGFEVVCIEYCSIKETPSMAAYPYQKNDFLDKVIGLIEENLGDENFSVEDLAEKLALSRSSLLRKIKSMTGLSVSVLIREIRLFNAREYLQDESYSISEIAYKVGFNSTSYFTKCFREQFGYPPGEEIDRFKEMAANNAEEEDTSRPEVQDHDTTVAAETSLAYDVFISYRQNDNQADRQAGQEGWVSGFVEALKRELRATLKGEVNIYFDNNPYDGLAEHHEVDASLKAKLKSYIFIPILSQTYCDPKSFAWQNEFKTYLELAGADRFGLKARLANGNIASRVLPVRIHDLDQKDIGLFEHALGSNLRSIDFVYKETGVNRPLRPNDNRQHNLEKTDYQNQVNKVANAVKDILASLKYQSGRLDSAALTPGTGSGKDSANSVSKKTVLAILGLVVIAVLAIIFVLPKMRASLAEDQVLDKTIAVLPFKNDSNDSSNVYLMNGLIEAVLERLQKIEDMQVTSRTTMESYRQVAMTIPELSEELDVNYFVEGSGQKVGNQILLTVQLIQANEDAQIWSKRYNREVEDIFALQIDIARDIATEIEAVITPEEAERLVEVPTENLVAYDYFLQGQQESRKETVDGLLKALELFDKAIAEDPEFANPYAYKAICFYFLEIFQVEKQHSQDINTNADKALLLNNALPESLIAKALFYMQDKQFNLAIEYFEQALEITPNSGWIHNMLTQIYANYQPDSEQYLRHALKGIKTAVVGQDSATISFTYLNLSNALVQNGFIKEAEVNIKKSLAFNPDNIFSQYVYTYIKLAGNFDLARAREELKATLALDTTRIDVLQELAKVCYTMRDYESSWYYYEKFIKIKQAYTLDLFHSEDVKIAYVTRQLAMQAKSDSLLNRYRDYALNEQSTYRDLSLSAYHTMAGDIDLAMEHFKKFADQDSFLYWFIIFLEEDPIISELSSHPDFMPTIRKIEEKFWARNRQMRETLEADGLEIE